MFCYVEADYFLHQSDVQETFLFLVTGGQRHMLLYNEHSVVVVPWQGQAAILFKAQQEWKIKGDIDAQSALFELLRMALVFLQASQESLCFCTNLYEETCTLLWSAAVGGETVSGDGMVKTMTLGCCNLIATPGCVLWID